MLSGATEPWVRLDARRVVLAGALCALGALVLSQAADLSQIARGFDRAFRDVPALAVASLAYAAAFWLRALAWQRLLPRTLESKRPAVGALWSILHASLVLNHALPVKAGEVARPPLLTRLRVPLSTATATTIAARSMDMAALLLIALIANAPHLGALAVAAWPIAAGAVLFGLGALFAMRVMPQALRARVLVAFEELRRVPPTTLALCALLTLASWLLEGGMALAAARSLGIPLTLSVAIGATAFTVASQVIHLTPGGIGVYELSMTAVLSSAGVSPEQALELAVVTHGLKFAYSFTVGVVVALPAAISALRGTSEEQRRASRLEVFAARSWNVLNEGKPFTPIYALAVIGLLSVSRMTSTHELVRGLGALTALVPLALVWFRFDFPLRLRVALWGALAAYALLFGLGSLEAVLLVGGLYVFFTVVMWGTVYYHLRIGTPWTNWTRFWRLVLENPDPTSGNTLEQLPKVLLLVWAFEYLSNAPLAGIAAFEAFTLAIAVGALLIHHWWFTWVPALPQRGLAPARTPEMRTSKRVIVIAIDGCRADRLAEARTPFLDRLAAEGTTFADLCTVYPARTVTAFASMLTGAAPSVHGMRSNFVPSLGVKCESVFDVLRPHGMRGVFVGIAHLIDAFGERDVRTVTAVMQNDEIDDALVARAQDTLLTDDPELLVLQLLSVDQTGHSRGSYNEEYLACIEETDARIERFLGWCGDRGYLEGATVLVTSDHGQGIGIGGHGHMSEPEINVPGIWWGEGVPAGVVSVERRFITEVAPTLLGLLGLPAPAQTVGQSLLSLGPSTPRPPVLFVIPAHNEAESIGSVIAGIHTAIPEAAVLVVDDGSSDGTGAIAAQFGATVVRHEVNRGLGAALRTAFAAARDIDADAVVYLDADGEYDPADARALLAPILCDEAEYVLGDRFAQGASGMTFARRTANAAFTSLLSVLCLRRILDGQTGMRAFSRRAVAVAEVIHDYNYAQVLTLDLLHKGMRLAQVPISYQRRQRGSSFIRGEYLWRVPLGIARELLAG